MTYDGGKCSEISLCEESLGRGDSASAHEGNKSAWNLKTADNL